MFVLVPRPWRTIPLRFAFAAVVAWSLLLVPQCSAHKDGAPLKACLTMVPGHEGTAQQPLSTATHQLEFAPVPSLRSQAGTSRQMMVVTLSSKSVVPSSGGVGGAGSATPFKGFFIQARSTTTGDANPVGVWDVSGASGLAKGVDCGGARSSAVTHVDNKAKPTVTLLWTPPERFTGHVVFVATVVKDFKSYWVGIQSKGLTLNGLASSGPMGVATTPNLKTTGTLGNSTSHPSNLHLAASNTSSSPGSGSNPLLHGGVANANNNRGAAVPSSSNNNLHSPLGSAKNKQTAHGDNRVGSRIGNATAAKNSKSGGKANGGAAERAKFDNATLFFGLTILMMAVLK